MDVSELDDVANDSEVPTHIYDSGLKKKVRLRNNLGTEFGSARTDVDTTEDNSDLDNVTDDSEDPTGTDDNKFLK